MVGRFPPETEERYFEWYVDQGKPLVRVAAMLSIPLWVVTPLLADAWVDTPVDNGIYVLAWAVAIPVLVVTVLVTYSTRRWVQLPMAVIAVEVVAFITFTAFYAFLSVRSQAGLLGSIIWFNTLPLLVRSPFRTTVFVTALTTATGSAFLAASVRELHTPRTETWPYVALLLVQLVMVPGIALMNERTLRQRFSDEQVIARQRAELTASRVLLRRYAPASVADRIEHGDTTIDSPQRRRVTVFFADVVGFTTLADRLDPEALAEIVNEYLGSVAHIIEMNGGTLNEFAGDGVMAIFGAPDELDPRDQVFAALVAASQLQRSLPEWSRRWYQLGTDQDLQARIGINTGVVSVGTFGSTVRATYTGIGLQTNIAARIQAQCPPGSVLLSKTSWHLVSDTVPCTPRGEVEVKGVHYPIAMYEPDELRSV
jgi:class 3 adenylate cyclase